MKNIVFTGRALQAPPFLAAAAPIILLLISLICIIIFAGAGAISDFSPYALLISAILAIGIALACGSLSRRSFAVGFRRSARQVLPAVPMLVFIALVSTTWMLSGVVPVLIEYGLELLSPRLFLFVTCAVCALISVLTGSSWSTIATIGVAFMGIGTVMGFNTGLVAGAIISGAYFGDKVSPLSDTTVVASSACGVDLFKHIRYLMLTAAPAMGIALIFFLCWGLLSTPRGEMSTSEIVNALADNFNLTPWVLVIPVVTIGMIMLRVPTLLTLFLSAVMGLAGIFIFQPGIVEQTGAESFSGIISMLWSETGFNTGLPVFDNLVSTSGILGMLPTIFLVLCAMVFGTAMISGGMIASLTTALSRQIQHRFSIVGTTVAGGLFINGCTADQYLSIIIGGNMFRNIYRKYGLEPRLLSRTLEDSISVTSVLIPWNSCGVTQSTVLGVGTLYYLPFCVFNYLSPLMSLLFAYTGFRIRQFRYTPSTT